MQLVIQSTERQVASEFREFVERRVHFALTRFAPRIRQVQVILRDMNGPRTNDDKRCRVEVSLHPTGQVLVQHQDSDWLVAIGRCVDRVANAVSRELARRRETRG